MSDAQVLGNELRDAREARDLSLEKVEQQTRIRVRYLEALERGDYAAFQSPVQASGFLRNYARFLSLDADELVERYNAVKSGRRRRRATRATSSPTQLEPPPDRRTQTVQGVLTELPPPPAPPEVAHERRRQRRSNLLIGSVLLGLALVVLCGIVFAGTQVLQTYLSRNNKGGLILSPLPSNLTVQPIATNTLAFTTTPDHPTPLPVPNANSTATNSGTGPVALQLTIVERTWLRVTVDGQISYMGSVAPNTVLQYQGTSNQVRIENAAGVRAGVNGKDLGIMGSRGQIVDQTFTASGAIPATPGPAPQGTASALNGASQIAGQASSTSPRATLSLTARPRVTATASVLPTITPSQTYTRTFTPSATPVNTATPTATLTPSNTFTPTLTLTPSLTPTPSITYTPSLTLTATITPFVLPHETSTPEGGEIRKQ